MDARRWLGSVVAGLIVLAPACSSGAPTAAPGASSPAVSATSPGRPAAAKGTRVDHVDPPAIPTAVEAALPAGTAVEQATALDALIGQGGEPHDDAWLAVYDAAAVPVLGDADAPLTTGTGDDPIGPAWWQVWMAGRAGPGQALRLVDLVKVWAGPDDARATEATQALLTDLRTAASAGNDAARFHAAFVQARTARAGRGILDRGAAADEIKIDLPTAQLLGWIILRTGIGQNLSALAAGASQGEGTSVPSAGSARGTAVPNLRSVGFVAASGSPPCSNPLGDDQATFWLNWAVNKIFAGISAVSPSTGGPFRFNWNAGDIGELPGLNSWVASNASEKAADVMGKSVFVANILTSLASIGMQLASFDVTGQATEAEGGATHDGVTMLERTKYSRENAKYVRIAVRIGYEGLAAKGNEPVACAASMLLNMAGAPLSFPAEGDAADGTEVIITGRDGFGERVLFQHQDETKQSTSNGQVTFGVVGKAQKRDLPASARQVQKEYSYEVSAQPEAVSATGMVSELIDGIQTMSNPLNGLASAVDIAKTTHWTLGEYVQPMIDWAADAYDIKAQLGSATVTGKVCGLDQPFSATGTFNDSGVTATMVFTFEPPENGAGAMSYTGVVDPTGQGVTGSGTYTLHLAEDGSGGTLVTTATGTVQMGATKTNVDTWTLTPTDPC